KLFLGSILTATGLVWGDGSISDSDYGVVISGGTMLLSNGVQPILTSGSGDFAFNSTYNIGTITTFRGWIEASGTWTAPTACSWSNLYSDSVDRNAQDVASGGKIFLQ